MMAALSHRPLKRHRGPSQDSGFHVVFLIDNSGSMVAACGGTSRFNAVMASVETFVDALMDLPDVYCSLAVFAERCQICLVGCPVNGELKGKLEGIRGVYYPKPNIDMGGSTMYLEALAALRTLSTQRVNVGVLLSDGSPSDRAGLVPFMHRLRAEMGHRCSLNTVGCGSFDMRILHELAATGGGTFHELRNLNKGRLRQVFSQLAASFSTLRNSVLRFGDDAMTRLPEKQMEPDDFWQRASPEELETASQACWAWVMLPQSSGTGVELKPSGNAKLIRLHKRPFAQGALRYAFHLFLSTNKNERLHLVTKESKYKVPQNSAQDVYNYFLENHSRAQQLASKFNEAVVERTSASLHQILNVQFVQAHVIQVSDESSETGLRYVTAERFIPGDFIKLNSNDGFVNLQVDADLADLAGAFSHFTFDHTAGSELCVDIQGVARKWTDPQFHSRTEKFGPGDLGKTGMRRFFKSHRCSRFCIALKLRRVDSRTLTSGDVVQAKSPSFA
eukprot:TRINITY_DN90659_c0_g1_i1.p1 TRINITY_DN90659_c0_g1~~TRINITY_DN90659_c0_g1_i1.p1  ORF type:complete len:504 (-),score=61.72 TRINITY_DN90659_c0_g1_i1:141-1652(-)